MTSSTSCEDLRDEIMRQDKFCVMTGGEESVCDTFQILPYAKGDEMGFFNTCTCTHCLLLVQYIETVTYVRSGDGAVIKDVNDTHNMASYFLKAFNIRLESANWPF